MIYYFLQSINKKCRFLLVDDSNQLPSVEAENALAELISSDCVVVTTLTPIFKIERYYINSRKRTPYIKW